MPKQFFYLQHVNCIKRTTWCEVLVIQARWRSHLCLRPHGGQTEVKEQICDPYATPLTAPPPLLPSSPTFLCPLDLFSSFFSFHIKVNIPQQQIRGNGSRSSTLRSIVLCTCEFGRTAAFFFLCLKDFFEAISEMTCFLHIFQTAPFCNANCCCSCQQVERDTPAERTGGNFFGVFTAVRDCYANCL